MSRSFSRLRTFSFVLAALACGAAACAVDVESAESTDDLAGELVAAETVDSEPHDGCYCPKAPPGWQIAGDNECTGCKDSTVCDRLKCTHARVDSSGAEVEYQRRKCSFATPHQAALAD